MQVVADVGGIPGTDCRGFCKYCYFRKVKDIEPIGCSKCSPNKIGCIQCSEGITETQNNFKLPFVVMSEVQSTLMLGNVRDNNLKVNISGGGDVSCYPHLEELSTTLDQFNLPIHLGYTSGKGIDDSQIANRLINNGVDEVTFTIFADDVNLRKQWMGDPNPEESLKAARIFGENTELHGASVIIPGVNDGKVLRNTCASLESWGATAFILMRFANTANQGLILNNGPIIKDVESHSINEFESLVSELSSEFSMRITGTPVWDPKTQAPFAIARKGNEIYSKEYIQNVTGEATIISSKIAAPYIAKIFESIGAEDVNVIATEKEIACLMTKEDLETIDLSQVKESVIIPGRSFIHQLDAERILSSDGKSRIVGRGPDKLSVDGEMSGTLTDEEVIVKELEAFRDLVDAINFYGMKKG
ncbi:methyl coenzyme M reductase-arginine methyltransferase Mmp10 [Methanobrevibacter filiformis]|uniref:Radical SAM superfamily protein n=1 Tax=Methanobrevibacter filiformis TaxID=55758 RepID=A0A166A6K9_9EURY|nr:methyl coenzyme M reductase-arginine methyltransferase Mmp10 [Methanobrevibacter filiformis]KZX11639.1 radical SAM superfamily protein [Methanobrevibacter filiformis]